MPAKTTRKPPKRTRRVKQPFDDRLEVRCYSAEKAHLAEEAKARGLSVGDLVRFQLGDLLGPGPAQTTQTPTEPAEARIRPPVVLSDLIAEAFCLSTGQALMAVSLGKVELDGEPWFHDRMPADLFDRAKITVDGHPWPEDTLD